MAVTSVHTAASPEAVWAVLADGWLYSNWVVGTSHMRAVETAWPQPGSRLFHASGLWPAVRRDESVVEESEPVRRLVLTARARPFGEARVSVDLAPEGTGCRITMAEHPSAGPGKWVHNPAADRLLKHRNDEALARLAAVAERRQRPAD